MTIHCHFRDRFLFLAIRQSAFQFFWPEASFLLILQHLLSADQTLKIKVTIQTVHFQNFFPLTISSHDDIPLYAYTRTHHIKYIAKQSLNSSETV